MSFLKSSFDFPRIENLISYSWLFAAAIKIKATEGGEGWKGLTSAAFRSSGEAAEFGWVFRLTKSFGLRLLESGFRILVMEWGSFRILMQLDNSFEVKVVKFIELHMSSCRCLICLSLINSMWTHVQIRRHTCFLRWSR